MAQHELPSCRRAPGGRSVRHVGPHHHPPRARDRLLPLDPNLAPGSGRCHCRRARPVGLAPLHVLPHLGQGIGRRHPVHALNLAPQRHEPSEGVVWVFVRGLKGFGTPPEDPAEELGGRGGAGTVRLEEVDLQVARGWVPAPAVELARRRNPAGHCAVRTTVQVRQAHTRRAATWHRRRRRRHGRPRVVLEPDPPCPLVVKVARTEAIRSELREPVGSAVTRGRREVVDDARSCTFEDLGHWDGDQLPRGKCGKCQQNQD